MKRFLSIFILLIGILVLFFSIEQTKSVSALENKLNTGGTNAAFRWLLTVQLTGGNSIQNSHSTMAALQADGVTATIKASTLTLSGQGDLARMNTVLFTTAAPLMDFLSGPLELALYLPAGSSPLTLNLEARTLLRSTLGSGWGFEFALLLDLRLHHPAPVQGCWRSFHSNPSSLNRSAAAIRSCICCTAGRLQRKRSTPGWIYGFPGRFPPWKSAIPIPWRLNWMNLL